MESDSSLYMKERPTLAKVMAILRALFEMEKKIDSLPLSGSGIGHTPSISLPGEWLGKSEPYQSYVGIEITTFTHSCI